MYVFKYILFTISCCIIKNSHSDYNLKDIYYPANQFLTWTNTTIDKLQCPIDDDNYQTPDWVTGPGFTSFKLHNLEKTKIKGYLCTGFRYITKCSENVFMLKEIKKERLYIKPDKIKCSDKVLQFIEGKIDDHLYPDYICDYNSVREEANIIYDIKPYMVGYDIYKSIYIDKIFPYGYCNRQPCNTHDDYTLWLQDTELVDLCGFDIKQDLIKYWYKQNSKNELIIWSEDSIYGNLSRACKKNICNKEGALFKSGEWFYPYPKDDNYNNMLSYINRLTRCSDKDLIKNDDIKYEIDRRFLIWNREKEYDECKDNLLKIQLEKRISRFDLQKFMPHSPGIHKVYRIFGDTIQEGVSEYKKIRLFPKMDGNNIGVDLMKIMVSNELFTKNNLHGISDGPNGLTMSNGIIFVKGEHRLILNNVLISDIHLHSSVLKEETKDENKNRGTSSNIDHDNDNKIYNETKNRSFTFDEGVFGSLDKFLSNILYFLIILLVTPIVLYLLFKISKEVSNLCINNSKNSDYIVVYNKNRSNA